MGESFDYLAARLETLEAGSRRRVLTPRSVDGSFLTTNTGQRLLNFGSNDYLGFAMSTLQGERQQAPLVPSGSMASALVCGWTDRHQVLADSIASLESTDAAVLFPSGFAACSGTISTLAEDGDLILSDEFNHASLIDGCRLSRATTTVYPHRDVEVVRTLLREKRHEYRRVWIVTDTIFSMDGDVAPLQSLGDLAEEFDASVIVDEAHGTGVFGEHGSGMCEQLDVKDQISIRIGTLSKAIGGQGGFVAGPIQVIEYLINHCRPLIYSTSLAPCAVEVAMASIDRIKQSSNERRHVRQLARQLRKRLGIQADPIESDVPIIPYVVGDDHKALLLAEQLRQAGYYVPAIRPPTVPDGTARLRISVSAAHTESMVNDLATVLNRF